VFHNDSNKSKLFSGTSYEHIKFRVCLIPFVSEHFLKPFKDTILPCFYVTANLSVSLGGKHRKIFRTEESMWTSRKEVRGGWKKLHEELHNL
jgi:hypothetical protein